MIASVFAGAAVVLLYELVQLVGKDPGVDPFGKARAGSEDEQGYYCYAVARLAAFSNVMWDVTNEYHLFRSEPWVERMGTLLRPIEHPDSTQQDDLFD